MQDLFEGAKIICVYTRQQAITTMPDSATSRTALILEPDAGGYGLEVL
jgi:hypothetical protein